MSAVADLMTEYDYSSRSLEDDRLDRGRMPADPRRKWGRRVDREFAEHHIRLIRAMEPANYPERNMRRIDWSDDEVIEIREQYASGNLSQVQIAAAFDCSKSTIQQIVTGGTYPHVGGPISPPKWTWDKSA